MGGNARTKIVVAGDECGYDGRMKRYTDPRGTLLIIVIATALMLAVHFMANGLDFIQRDALYDAAPASFQTAVVAPELNSVDGGLYREEETLEKTPGEKFGPEQPEFVEEIYSEAPQPKIERPAPDYQPLVVTGKPKIAIIIDDMGVNRKNSFEVIDLDVPLTLAFLPYAEQLGDITAKAKDHGHELMIHMPMQAMSAPVSLGPIAIKSGMDERAVKENMAAAFASFEGYVGVNNHMGSRVTQDAQLMGWVMEALGERGLYFVDSKTIAASVAAQSARQNGLPTAERDVFLDHEETPEFVSGALRKVEEIAANKGYAIAIGHPKDVTIAGLRGWVDDVRSRGFEIVHAGELVQRPVGPVKPDGNAAGDVIAEVEAVSHKLAQIEAAAGDIVAVERVDPNSAQAREAILKKLLGQD